MLYTPVVRSATDIWAGGYRIGSDDDGYSGEFHFDGKTWREHTPPPVKLTAPICDGSVRPCAEARFGGPTILNKRTLVMSVSIHHERADGTFVNTSYLLQWTGKRWKRLAKTWPWLISGITPDRDGGLWFTARDDFTPVSGWADQIIVHQTARGAVTSVPLRASVYGLSAARGIVFAMGETSSRKHIWAIRP
ncbi:hypothetical protein GCM10027589_18900 [Actinocorallia lasiicapitis]